MAAALGRVLNDDALRVELIGRGTERARQFTWRATAERTLATLLRVNRDRPSRIGARQLPDD